MVAESDPSNPERASSLNINQKKRRVKSIVLILACLLWAGTIAVGMKILWSYKSTPGSSGSSHPEQWPKESKLQRNLSGPTLLMFGHPHCPCTRASMRELARLTSRFHKQIQTYVIFAIPEDVSEDWGKTELLESADSVIGAKVVIDQKGSEAVNFGIETSGHTMLYNKEGTLLFSGGITAVRGHEGESFGQQRITSFLTTGKADRNDSPVFGCALLGPHEAEALKNKKESRNNASN